MISILKGLGSLFVAICIIIFLSFLSGTAIGACKLGIRFFDR